MTVETTRILEVATWSHLVLSSMPFSYSQPTPDKSSIRELDSQPHPNSIVVHVKVSWQSRM